MRLAHHFISEIHFCRTLSGDRPQNFGENGKNSFSRHYDKPGGEVGGAPRPERRVCHVCVECGGGEVETAGNTESEK